MMRAYCLASNRPYPIPGIAFCLAWNCVKVMVQSQGVWARGLDPVQSSPESLRGKEERLRRFKKMNELALMFSGLEGTTGRL